MATYGITSSTQIIDAKAIENACKQLIALAEDFQKSADQVNEAKNECGSEALSVDNKTMEQSFDDLKKGIEQVKETICSFAKSLRDAAYRVSTEQWEEYNAYVNQQNAQQQTQNNN